jgi:hypothetical protein
MRPGNRTDTADMCKSLVKIALSYGLSIYFVAGIWKPELRLKLSRRMEDQGCTATPDLLYMVGHDQEEVR